MLYDDLDYAFHEGRIQVLDQRPDEGHLLAGVVEDDAGIGGGAAEAVGRHDHGQIAGVHLGHRGHLTLREDLQEADEVREDQSVQFRQPVHDGHRLLSIGAVLHALRVQLVGDQELVQLSVPAICKLICKLICK